LITIFPTDTYNYKKLTNSRATLCQRTPFSESDRVIFPGKDLQVVFQDIISRTGESVLKNANE